VIEIHLNIEANGDNPADGTLITDLETGDLIGHLDLPEDHQTSSAIEKVGQILALVEGLAEEEEPGCGDTTCATCAHIYERRQRARELVAAITGQPVSG
jgi:hypothetical protein